MVKLQKFTQYRQAGKGYGFRQGRVRAHFLTSMSGINVLYTWTYEGLESICFNHM